MRLGVGAPPLPLSVLIAMNGMHGAIAEAGDKGRTAPHPPPTVPAERSPSAPMKDITYGLGMAFHALAY